MRRLDYRVVETGKCQHCGHDAGRHATDGLCNPQSTAHLRHADVPEPCYRGRRVFAFVDLDAPHEPPVELIA